MNTLTFKPLKGNRYRCNQTGKIMKKGQLEAYKQQQQSKAQNSKDQKERITVDAYYGTFICPGCNREQHDTSSKYTCTCKTKLLLRQRNQRAPWIVAKEQRERRRSLFHWL